MTHRDLQELRAPRAARPAPKKQPSTRTRQTDDVYAAREQLDPLDRQRIAREEAAAYYSQPLRREWWT